MYLEELADNIHLENEKYEAKALLNRGDIVSWLKSIAGFANASGGEFFIGVEDKTNKLICLKDRLEISSPGGFYRGEKIGKTYDLSGVISKRRNELIAGVLVACNVMESAGTGFDKITEEYASADKAHKPYIYSTSDHFTLVLPDLTYDNGVANENIPELSFMPVSGGTKFDGKVLSFCYYKAHKVSEIAEYLGISDSTYLRKNILENLANNEYLDKSKLSKSTFFKTNPDKVELI